jgi:phosphoglycerol transferase MdoB-like AlkP superfamily enzyme
MASLILILTIDFYFYQYTNARINLSLIELITPLSVSIKMVWQSYPILWILFILVIIYSFIIRAYVYLIQYFQQHAYFVRFFPFMILLMILFIWGSLRRYPLTWSDAYANGTNGTNSILCINPAESIFNALYFYEEELNESENLILSPDSFYLKKDSIHKREMVNLKNNLQNNIGNELNVVLLLAESLSTYKTTLSGNTLNATPALNQLAKKSIYFPSCFTPHYGTARAIWCLFTGIPDVSWRHLSTHRIQSSHIHSTLNEIPFNQYFFLMGGEGNWADIKGFFSNTFKNGTFFDQHSFNIKTTSAWGIDDYDLLMRADSLFQLQKQPFFALIQTSGNHRPFLIPESATLHGFKKKSVSMQEVTDNGFINIDEFHSLSYLDFCINKFMEKAASSKYYKKTLFIIVGDHGNIGDASKYFGKRWNDYKMNMIHVPLLFYAPSSGIAGVDSSYSSIMDIIPSIATLKNTKSNYSRNGISLFSDTVRSGLFYMLHDTKEIGWHTPSGAFKRPFKIGSSEQKINSGSFDSLSYEQAAILAYYYYRNQLVNHQ